MGPVRRATSRLAAREIEVFLDPRVRPHISTRTYKRGDFLFFGGETKGLGKEFLSERTDRAYRIPIFEPGVRSLNLSNAVSIVVYEALRQTGALKTS